MQKIVLPKLEIEVYKEIFENGLTLYVIPKKNGNNIYTTFTVKYGSMINEFIPFGKRKMIKVEDGIAHFLEHKVFEEENGDDPFVFFGKRGADVNASTSIDKTSYVFSGASSFAENMNYLLDFVQRPYFTDENVEKEKGIIIEELKMYDDNPYSVLNDKSIYNSFQLHPIRNPVGGTVDSISKITKEMLYTCYNTFYHPSNMFVVVSGNVDPDMVVRLVEKNQKGKNQKVIAPIKIQTYKEPDEVFLTEEVVHTNVVISKVAVNFKINYSKIKKYSPFIIRITLFNFFNIKFGITSLFLEKMKEDEIITDSLEINMVNTDTHFLFMILGDSEKPANLIEKIKEEMKKADISPEDIDRKKKTLLSSSIYASDNVYSLNSKIVSNVINYGEVLDDFKLVKELDAEVCQDILKSLDFSHISTVIVSK